MFPIDFMPLLVGFTNKNLQKLRYANTTVGEM
ncbi:TPA: hypothetical protein N0F65_008045 [Lagenidium giganteum]|uniref:Uncharacterized protein n=1 Tax=Lagenidium giganteum TaxID=4803 RepID=A0AAV2YKG0_9STRA|nr:TPA: hypothetical protein N0F65_008045 [Lagenidium giganteum]